MQDYWRIGYLCTLYAFGMNGVLFIGRLIQDKEIWKKGTVFQFPLFKTRKKTMIFPKTGFLVRNIDFHYGSTNCSVELGGQIARLRIQHLILHQRNRVHDSLKQLDATQRVGQRKTDESEQQDTGKTLHRNEFSK